MFGDCRCNRESQNISRIIAIGVFQPWTIGV
nr:MAG TPA: Prion-related protein testis-specific [Caudoviricetes sp.]